MHQRSNVKLARIEKLVRRSGFPGRFHRVDFKWTEDGLVHSSFIESFRAMFILPHWNEE